jgi:hypothetical protein
MVERPKPARMTSKWHSWMLGLFAFVIWHVWAAAHQWPVATEVLRRYPHEMAYSISSRHIRSPSSEYRTESFLLFPSFQELTITQSDGAGPIVDNTRVRSPFLFFVWALIAGYLLWYWVRKQKPPSSDQAGPDHV